MRGWILCLCIGLSTLTSLAQERAGALSVAVEESRVDAKGPRRLALCIGINGYKGEEYRPLRFAVADAKEMGQALEALGYETIVMTDDSAAALQPTYANLDLQIRKFARLAQNPEDTLIITFAGHGNQVGKQAGLIPLDFHENKDLLTISRLFEYVEQAQCRAGNKLIILDSCRSGGDNAANRMGNGFMQALSAAESCLVLSGCAADQSSVEEPGLGHGRLSAALLWGLVGEKFSKQNEPAGQAYAKDEEFLTTGRLYDYVQKVFGERGWVSTQSPRMFGQFDARAKAILARRELPKPPPLSDTDRRIVGMMLREAEDLFGKADYAEMVKSATTALRIDERSADAMAMRGLAYCHLGFDEKARTDADAALAIDPDQAVALQVKGISIGNGENTDYPAAIQALTRSSQLASKQADRWPILNRPLTASARWLLLNRCYEKQKNWTEQINACTQVIELKDSPPRFVAIARIARACAYQYELNQPDKAEPDYDAVIAMDDAAPDVLAAAIVNRRIAREGKGDKPSVILAEYQRVVEMDGAPDQLKALSYLNRGLLLEDLGESQKAIADYTKGLEISDIPATLRATMLLNRGTSLGFSLGEVEKSMADFNAVLSIDGVDDSIISSALLCRGTTYLHDLKEARKAIADFDRALAMKDLTLTIKAPAYLNRGMAYMDHLQDVSKALADYSAVIELKDCPLKILSTGYLNRAQVHLALNDTQKAMDDLTTLIAMKGIAQSIRAMALLQRAEIYETKLKDNESAIKDLKTVIATRDILEKYKVEALEKLTRLEKSIK